MKETGISVDLVESMTRPEQLQAKELLWGAISRRSADLATPAWHEEVLEGRMSELRDGRAMLISIDELKSRFVR